ncbi:MAG: hypothetical protein ACK5JP_13030, partial [Akkermansiaceae bacterium]
SLSLRQREDGTWPFRVDPKTEAVIEDYSSSVIYAVMLFEKLVVQLPRGSGALLVRLRRKERIMMCA